MPRDGHRPLVLVVFHDLIAEGSFLDVERAEIERAGMGPPLWVSHTGLLERVGPMRMAWLNPVVQDRVAPF